MPMNGTGKRAFDVNQRNSMRPNLGDFVLQNVNFQSTIKLNNKKNGTLYNEEVPFLI
ncbi:hypothetical protein ACOI1C_17960 [Bacillus sp. DJP31]|uniref:hypothetical protein n=1 Tax=Bacillus sp. DJP31 TaxID=3409789 RepID=UPI003BB5BE5B